MSSRKLTQNVKDNLQNSGVVVPVGEAKVCSTCYIMSSKKKVDDNPASNSIIESPDFQKDPLGIVKKIPSQLSTSEESDSLNKTGSQSSIEPVNDCAFAADDYTESFTQINRLLSYVGSSTSLDKKCLNSDKAKSVAFNSFATEIASKLFKLPPKPTCNFQNCTTLQNIKEASVTVNKNDLVRIISLIPNTISTTSIMNELGCGRKIVEAAKARQISKVPFNVLPEKRRTAKN